MSTTALSTQEFSKLSTSGNTAEKFSDNEIGSTGSGYSSNPLQSVKCVSSYSSVPHDCTDAYKASVFSGLVASPLPIGNIYMQFILLYFSSHSVSRVIPSSVISGDGFTAPQCWPGVCCWWITLFFSSTVTSMLPLSSVLFCISGIVTGNETVSTSDVLFASLAIFGTIISIYKCSPMIPMAKSLFLVII